MAREYLKSVADASLEIPREVTESVRDIVDTVRDDGDRDVRELTRRFDDVERETLRVSDAELESAGAVALSGGRTEP